MNVSKYTLVVSCHSSHILRVGSEEFLGGVAGFHLVAQYTLSSFFFYKGLLYCIPRKRIHPVLLGSVYLLLLAASSNTRTINENSVDSKATGVLMAL